MLKRDLSVTLRDARAGLAQWWDALRQVGDNPLHALLRRNWAKRSPRHPLLKLLSHVPPVFVLAALGYGIGLSASGDALLTGGGAWFIPLLVAAAGLYIVWLGMGLYHISVDALIFLGRPGSRSGDELQLDESLMGVRLTEHEILIAVLATLLPRIWLRWLSAPVVALAGYWLVLGWVQSGETASFTGDKFLTASLEQAHQSALAAWAPLSVAMLYLAAVPAAVILLLFLIAMGRSLEHRWQVQLLAFSISACQLGWIPWAYFHLLSWRFFGGHQEDSVGQQSASLLFPFIALALLVAALHFTRRVPWARLALAAGVPPATGVLFASGLFHYANVSMSLWNDFWHYLFSWSWVASSFALYNPLAVPLPGAFGYPAGEAHFFRSMEWYRFPVIWLIWLSALAICAHAARLAVQDLRRSED